MSTATPCWPRAGPRRQELLAAEKDHPHRRGHRRERRPLRGKDTIALRVGTAHRPLQMAKHFTIGITEDSFTFTRHRAIAAEAALDGVYVLRTACRQTLATDDVVLRCKGLEDVERLLRTLDSELDFRPIRHRLADRVHAHMFLRMLWSTWSGT